MESVQEQLEYGDSCMHGTGIGTSGGADLMCHLCESWLTSHHECMVCGERMWVQHGMWVVTCKPNPERSKLAELIYKTRNELRRDGRYNASWRKILAEILMRDRYRLPRNVHEYNREFK